MERKLMMKRLLGWAPGEEMLFANCAGMPAVGCDTWLSSLLCIPDEGAIQKAADPDQDDTDTDSDSSGPEAPATEPMEPAPPDAVVFPANANSATSWPLAAAQTAQMTWIWVLMQCSSFRAIAPHLWCRSVGALISARRSCTLARARAE